MPTRPSISYIEDTRIWWIVDPKLVIKNYMRLTDCIVDEAVEHWCKLFGLEYTPPDATLPQEP